MLSLLNTFVRVSYKAGAADNEIERAGYQALQTLVQKDLEEEMLKSRLPQFWFIVLIIVVSVKTPFYLVRDVFFK